MMTGLRVMGDYRELGTGGNEASLSVRNKPLTVACLGRVKRVVKSDDYKFFFIIFAPLDNVDAKRPHIGIKTFLQRLDVDLGVTIPTITGGKICIRAGDKFLPPKDIGMSGQWKLTFEINHIYTINDESILINNLISMTRM
jgi:hypothetical protein